MPSVVLIQALKVEHDIWVCLWSYLIQSRVVLATVGSKTMTTVAWVAYADAAAAV